jgi:hypothetical protein
MLGEKTKRGSFCGNFANKIQRIWVQSLWAKAFYLSRKMFHSGYCIQYTAHKAIIIIISIISTGKITFSSRSLLQGNKPNYPVVVFSGSFPGNPLQNNVVSLGSSPWFVSPDGAVTPPATAFLGSFPGNHLQNNVVSLGSSPWFVSLPW